MISNESENDQPLVSVIIPSYNRAKYIQQAVESVVAQTYSPIELIVVDDGSTDGSLDLLEQLESKGQLKLFVHPGYANRGQSASLNLGITRSKGEYVAILDSDDYFSHGKIKSQVEYLTGCREVGMVYGLGYAVDERGDPLFILPNSDHVEESDPNNLLIDCYMALPGGALVRREVFESVGLFEEKFRAGQDHDMALRIMEKFPVAFLPEVSFYYRKHGDSISAKGLETRWRNAALILERAVGRYPYRKSTIRKRRAVIDYRLGQVLWSSDRKIQALSRFIAAGVRDPKRATKVIFNGRK